MWSLRLLLLTLVVLGASAARADDPPEFECGDEGGGGSMPPIEGVVKAYIVYVSYPGDPDSLVPPSAGHTISEVTKV